MDTLELIRQKIAEAKAQSPIAAHQITLLGASKGQAGGVLSSFIDSGLTDFGENRVQEAFEKWPNLQKKHPNIRLHLIGPLQTNKAEDALELFDVIQTVDRPKLAEAIIKAQNEKTKTKEFYIQVNTGEEEQKSGIMPREAAGFIKFCRDLGLNVVGLMCVPPADKQPAPHFAYLRKLALDNNLTKLSMGMSSDYETAIRMGSTCVRVGTALFGERN